MSAKKKTRIRGKTSVSIAHAKNVARRKRASRRLAIRNAAIRKTATAQSSSPVHTPESGVHASTPLPKLASAPIKTSISQSSRHNAPLSQATHNQSLSSLYSSSVRRTSSHLPSSAHHLATHASSGNEQSTHASSSLRTPVQALHTSNTSPDRSTMPGRAQQKMSVKERFNAFFFKPEKTVTSAVVPQAKTGAALAMSESSATTSASLPVASSPPSTVLQHGRAVPRVAAVHSVSGAQPATTGQPAKEASSASHAPSDRSAHSSKQVESASGASFANTSSMNAAQPSKPTVDGRPQEKPHTDRKAPKLDMFGMKKKQRRKLQKRSLQEYFDKAGYDLNADLFKKRAFQVVVVLFLIASIAAIIYGIDSGTHASDLTVFILGLWTAVFAAVMLLMMASVYFFLDYRIYQRTREIEEVLPDFLQLASSNISAGMPIDRALWYSIRPNFGVLAKEMEEVAKSTMAGEDLEVSLVRFTDRYDSVVLKRSISILIEGLNAGGEMADLLNKIALNIEEMKIMKKEMAASVTTYAIFITFASIIIAPFLFALATELLTIIIKITGSLDLSSNSSMLTMASPDPSAVGNFKIFSICMLFVSTVFSASIVSVIKNGNVVDGIKSIPVYAVVAITIYYLSTLFLHGIFAGII